ncbi:MAG: cysteine--tRNA ligase [Melioribacteraceae bacterium]|nr:cysteine--tRNA ligase [Melioribacteraceae bacterium]
MRFYNTFSKSKEVFEPANLPNVTFYVCGPTIYDYFHIGNARSFIMADILRRYLEFKGYHVKYVMNLTDVDDRIIKKSIDEKKPSSEISNFYEEAFFEDIKSLKVKPATVYPKATQHIDDMIKLIQELEDKEIAYNVDGNVFYNVSKFNDYGKLSGKNLEELSAGARVEINEIKKNPLDFALWKKAKEGEPSWNSPWGKGRPGWHIECSAMSSKHLGDTIDIHAGGNDLIFPHHENEIAQSEGAHNHKFVKYWIHFGFLNINEEKMSKSLGNFLTAREILKKYTAESIRLFFAQTYYGGPLNFSFDLLKAAEKGSEKIFNLAAIIETEIKKDNNVGISPEFDIKYYYDEFEKVMDDDLNTPQAVAIIFDFIRNANKVIADYDNINVSFFHDLKKFLKDTAQSILGILDFEKPGLKESSGLDDKLIEILLSLRIKLKKEKNFFLADQIRDDLNKLGIVLKDTKEGTTYKIR